jgi:hypothetical protein
VSVITVGASVAPQHEEPYNEIVAYDAWVAARRLRDFLADEDPSAVERIAIREMLRETLDVAQEAYGANEAALAAAAPATAA